MFMIEQNYRGYLLASHPRRLDALLRRSVILVLDHDKTGAIGLQINKPFTNDVTFRTVMENVNMSVSIDQPLYNGGQESINRIHVVHSLDWFSPTTSKITDKIGVSNDLSVLAAISQNEGPEYYRVCAGFTRWSPSHLEGEIAGEAPWTVNQSWSFAPSNYENVFGLDDIDQWHGVINESNRLQISNWF
jgi:putative transcriptional regulator